MGWGEIQGETELETTILCKYYANWKLGNNKDF
jgi:hypothetical protein